MHGVTDSLRIALSGLQLAQDSLATTSNNVANVNTPGYTRKVVEQEARVVDGRGTGVREVKIARKMDEFLEYQIRQQQAALGRSAIVSAYAGDVQGLIFGNPSDGATGLATHLDELGTRLEAAATKPDDAAQRAAFTWAAEDLFQQIGGAAETVQVLRRDADRRIHALVAEANEALLSVHKLNLDLKRSGENAELLDQRDRLVQDLSRKLDVRTFTHDDGTLAVFTPDGQPLVEHSPRQLVYRPASAVARNAPFQSIEVYDHREIDPGTGEPHAGAKGRVLVGGGTRAALPPELDPADGYTAIAPTVTSGELGGLLATRDKHLPELDDQLQELSRLLAFSLNAAHNRANALPLATTLEGGRALAEMTAGAVAGTAHIVVHDPAAPEDARAYAIDLAAVRTEAETIDPVNWQAHLATALDTVLAPRGIDVVETAAGTVRFSHAGGLELAWDEGTSAVTESDATGHVWTYGLGHYLGLNDLVAPAGSDPTALRLRPDIAADPMRLASAVVDVGAVLDAALPVEHAAAVGGAGDNRGLNALADALDRTFTSVRRGDLPPANVSVREYLGDVINIQAIHAQTAERSMHNDSILADELDYQRASISGVNMDEEMAHLLQLQQAYATSARLISTADQMLQDLLNMKR